MSENGKMKKARIIELYDANIQISFNNHDDPFGRYETKKRFVVDGRELEKLARYFDLPIGTISERYYNKKEGEDRVRTIHLQEEEFEIQERLTQYDEGNLKEIYAEIVSANLLEIKLEFDEQGPKAPAWCQHLTYSGSFLVEWAE